MGRNLETLTSLFLAGTFADRPAARTLERPRPAPRDVPMREVPPPAPDRFAAVHERPAPARRSAARQRTSFPPPQPEEELTHPGQVLAQQLADLGLTASDLARDIDVPVNRVTAIINGQRGVTADTALRLAHWFGVDPEDWLGLQLEYELDLARRDAGARVKKLPRLADRFA
jgi:addiction module HigA family antidote